MRFSEFRQYVPKSAGNVFVFVCEDEFLVEESRGVWQRILSGNWVLEKFHSKEFEEMESSRLMDEAMTPSLFSQSRALLVTNAEKVSKRRVTDLTALHEIKGSSLKVILICNNQRSTESWMRAFPLVEIDPLRPAEVAKWLMERYGVSAEIARYVVENAGTDLYPLHNEMEKLRTYVGEGRAIEIRDVDASILRSEKFGAFELDDAILARDYKKTVHVLSAMLEEGMEPLQILSRIVRVWRQVFVGKGLAGKQSAKEVAAAAGVPAWKAADFAASCRTFGWSQIASGFRELLNADRAFKSSSPNVEAYFNIMLWKLVA